MIPHRIKLTADAVARAVVTAARITGEDPETIVERKPALRCRHLALHALVHCFRGVTPSRISEALACPGKSSFFYRTSLWFTLGKAPQRDTAPADWWRDEDLDAVVRAVEKQIGDALASDPAPTSAPEPAWAAKIVDEPRKVAKPRVDAGVTRIAAAAKAVERRAPPPAKPAPPPREERPIHHPSPRSHSVTPGKMDLYRMLGDAVRNTANMTPKSDD